MGLFNFLKRKELKIIESLKRELEALKENVAQQAKDLQRYQNIRDVEDEIIKQKELLEDINIQIKDTKENYLDKRKTYTKLTEQIKIYEDSLEFMDFGLYTPTFDFEHSDQYREKQKEIIAQQKQMIKQDLAAICTMIWTVEGSVKKGESAVKRYKKLLLRAFNGECDALVTKVRWNNIENIQKRMDKAFQSINQLGQSFKIHLSNSYLKLKQEELILEYEYQAKRQQEKEEMRAIREEEREEEKARREIERAIRQAEKEEEFYQKALEKAKEELGQHNTIALKQKLEELEKELEEVKQKKERALSMAQQTKRGYVYIISNIGAFGENIYKIGMTRRIEPMDRVRELGDASVPFQFDVHAMIYSDEARTLEAELHKRFEDNKLNMLNNRKEFFNVSLEEIKNAIIDLGFEAEFTMIPEAMEYRETLAILEQKNNYEKLGNKADNTFPEEL
ncbi:DUF4041 domain-containing protein [Riemerella anatipestifer]|uniref:DUF4041 domain-containing protein n=1 Tax=Riemerella anatipestifer TaxID=34085 RepID=UPI001AD6B709|nr:DUF4041 domain-containing protein [Riemerella anatipestifer]MBO4234047.1 DUF4041 domain-containing protein [Riemerella anatipestifer]MDD1539684.1 DUF4041 domain-containing protein [Riemerella anatipestifer]